ncbi:capsid assembly protein [Elioraea sp.]|uniref:capsid assembly protein n=1 Tax=Elioraea sp. TaxID=2185103 RepID=UPI0025C4E7E8|nr:hypothetical protein [Elioraea sp.]
MPDNLLEITLEDGAAAPKPKGNRPADVPEKFWDEETGNVRIDQLIKSYRELEKRLSRMVTLPGDDADEEERSRFLRALGVPETPDAYTIEERHPLVTLDKDVNARLHKAGFTPAQVQLVYDLAADRLLPLIAEAAQMFEAERELDKLRDHFGGDERWQRAAKQITAWGRANLAPAVFAALSATASGVLALQKMMEKGEPALVRSAEPEGAASEDELRNMMRDPRYWRKRDPDFVARVSDGFRKLFPGER